MTVRPILNTIQALLSFVVIAFLTGCSTSDFFLGKDNRPPPKDLPQISQQVATTILWQKKLGKGSAEAGLHLKPALVNEVVYAVSANGKVYALNSQTGAEIFAVNLGNDISAGVAADNRAVYVGTKNGNLIALDSQNGRVLWRESLPSMMLSPPVVDQGMVVARSVDGSVSAYTQDGDLLWRYHLQAPILSVRGNAAPVVGGGVVILTSDSGFFVVLDQLSGMPVADLRIASGRGNNPVARLVDMDATPQINNDVLFGSAYQSMIFAINLTEGAPLWRQEALSTQQDFALSPDSIYVTTDIDHVASLKQIDGAVRWQNDQLEGRYLSPTVAVPGRVGAIDFEGYLHWFSANDGRLIGQTRVGKTNASSAPLVMRDRILWQLADGTLLALRPN